VALQGKRSRKKREDGKKGSSKPRQRVQRGRNREKKRDGTKVRHNENA